MKSFFCSLLVLLSLFIRSCGDEKPVDRTIVGVKTSVATFVDFFPEGTLHSPTMIRGLNDLEQEFGVLSPGNIAGSNVKQFFLNGGREAWVVRLAGSNNAATIIGDSVSKTGMYSLDRIESFNLLCLPRLPDTSEASKLMRVAGMYCEKRRAILVMDVPQNLTDVNRIVDWTSSLRFEGQRNVALYYPSIRTPDQSAGISVAGTVAGVIARVDSQVGVWKAPAGPLAVLTNVSSFEREISTQEAALLNDGHVNPLRSLPGKVIWGAKTLSDNYEWQYLPVRRLGLYIEENVSRGTEWAMFEPNGDSLWAQVRLHVTNFMHGLFLNGALIGSKPDEAYFVQCDRRTTTQDDINNHIFNIEIGFAAIKRAEFIILRIRQHSASL